MPTYELTINKTCTARTVVRARDRRHAERHWRRLIDPSGLDLDCTTDVDVEPLDLDCDEGGDDEI